MTVCVDANIAVRLVVNGPADAVVFQQWRSWAQGDLVAPTLLYYEATNAIHRMQAAGMLTPDQADRALDLILRLPVQVSRDSTLHQRAAELARDYGLPAAYDAHYLAVAEREGAEFWTADARLANAVAADLDWVHLLD